MSSGRHDPTSRWDAAKTGERLRILRAAVGALERPPTRVGQRAFAGQCNLSQARYAQYENGSRVPSISAAAALRDRYGITLDWLYLGIERHMPSGLMKEIARQAAGDTTRDVARDLEVSHSTVARAR
jgi:DNA-binding XRE family transcriptional regulator